MGFSQKVLPELEASVGESRHRAASEPPLLPIPPRRLLASGVVRGGMGCCWLSVVVGGSCLCSLNAGSAQGKAEQRKPLWCCVTNPPACPVPCRRASPPPLPGVSQTL